MIDKKKVDWGGSTEWTPKQKAWHSPQEVGRETLRPKSGWMRWQAPEQKPQQKRKPVRRGLFDN
jgi:hypothetical protein